MKNINNIETEKTLSPFNEYNANNSYTLNSDEMCKINEELQRMAMSPDFIIKMCGCGC